MTDLSPTWDPAAPGVVELPSGRLVRGRGLRSSLPEGPAPELGVHLLGSPPPAVSWESQWIRWAGVPADGAVAWVRQRYDHGRWRRRGSDGSSGGSREAEVVVDQSVWSHHGHASFESHHTETHPCRPSALR